MYRRIRSPKQRFIRSFVSRQHFPAQRKGGGISKGGNLGSPLWLRAKHACIDCRLRKNKPDTKKAYYKRSAATTTIIHYSFFTIHFFRSPFDLVPEARTAQNQRLVRTNQPRSTTHITKGAEKTLRQNKQCISVRADNIIAHFYL